MFSGAVAPWHWAIVAIVVIILFGSKKLPEAARGLGRSLRIFKSEMKEMNNDDKPEIPAAAQPVESSRVEDTTPGDTPSSQSSS